MMEKLIAVGVMVLMIVTWGMLDWRRPKKVVPSQPEDNLPPFHPVSKGILLHWQEEITLRIKDDPLGTVIEVSIDHDHLDRRRLVLDCRYQHTIYPSETGCGQTLDLVKLFNGPKHLERVPDENARPVFQVEWVNLPARSMLLTLDEGVELVEPSELM